MQPESSGCNEVKYNLNVDTIEAIFKTYPAGKEIFNYNTNLFVSVLLYDYVVDNLIIVARKWYKIAYKEPLLVTQNVFK